MHYVITFSRFYLILSIITAYSINVPELWKPVLVVVFIVLVKSEQVLAAELTVDVYFEDEVPLLPSQVLTFGPGFDS
jgi:hypothetical protein